MSTFSPLQVLPIHVVELIVDYLISSRKVFTSPYFKSKEHSKLLMPLLWACHNLRAAAHPRYCRFLQVDFTDCAEKYNGGHVGDDLGEYRTYKYLGYDTRHLAKELEIKVVESDVYNGRLLARLDSVPRGCYVFPHARRVTFNIHLIDRFDEGHDDDCYLPADEGAAIQQSEPLVDANAEHLKIEANIKAFAQRVRVMAPKISEVAVRPDYSSSDDIGLDPNFGMLTTHLYKLVNRVEYKCEAGLYYHYCPANMSLSLVSNLVHIKYACNSAPDQFLHLARLNALTLLSLTIDTDVGRGHNKYGFDFCGLLQGEDSSYTTYPHLIKLKVCAPLDKSITSRSVLAVDSTVVPFPSLRSLCFKIEYPFDDDTLFRGNAATLERLVIDLDIQAVKILCRHRVFSPTSHPKLCFVTTLLVSEHTPDALAAAEDDLLFSLSIGPGAFVREVSVATCTENPEAALTCLGNHANITTLTLRCIRLDLWNVITLVKSLPLLSDLHYSLWELGEMPVGVTLDDLPSYVCSRYALISKRFQRWHVLGTNQRDRSNQVMAVLLLALVCPNFDHVIPVPWERELFMKKIKVIISLDKLKPYASRLRLLLDNL
ncbi:hypothetical protein GGI20_003715 [Coemansia sp. BCRC 34301]|nr:hypothetical protein GGI20_003715 [Coemansia sp. BCRC 34301]